MATLIRRADALRVINRLEEKARENGDTKGADWIIKCYNAIMCCRVETRIFCNKCGKRIGKAQESDGGGNSSGTDVNR